MIMSRVRIVYKLKEFPIDLYLAYHSVKLEDTWRVREMLLSLLNSADVFISHVRGARWLSGRVSDSGARGPGFETYRRRVVSLSKTLYSPKVLVNYPGSDGSVPT